MTYLAGYVTFQSKKLQFATSCEPKRSSSRSGKIIVSENPADWLHFISGRRLTVLNVILLNLTINVDQAFYDTHKNTYCEGQDIIKRYEQSEETWLDGNRRKNFAFSSQD